MLLVAVENLFALNRTYGYDAGDEIIAALARRLRENIRVCDAIGRYAGNKFAILLENCDAEEMPTAALRLIEAVRLRGLRDPRRPDPAPIFASAA